MTFLCLAGGAIPNVLPLAKRIDLYQSARSTVPLSTNEQNEIIKVSRNDKFVGHTYVCTSCSRVGYAAIWIGVVCMCWETRKYTNRYGRVWSSLRICVHDVMCTHINVMHLKPLSPSRNWFDKCNWHLCIKPSAYITAFQVVKIFVPSHWSASSAVGNSANAKSLDLLIW